MIDVMAILSGIQTFGQMFNQAQKRNAGEDVEAPIKITKSRSSESRASEPGANEDLLKQIQAMSDKLDDLSNRFPQQQQNQQQPAQTTEQQAATKPTEEEPFTLEGLLDKLRGVV